VQIVGVAEVTDVVPSSFVDTAGVNDPPGIADEGMLEIVGVGDPVALAIEALVACNPTTATRPLSAMTATLRVLAANICALRPHHPVHGIPRSSSFKVGPTEFNFILK
jgi:hypothetical protein